MASPLKISARVEIDASQARVGARDAVDAVQSIKPAVDQASAGLSKVAAASASLPKAGDAAQQVAKRLSSIEPAAKQAETAMQRLVNASVGLHSGPANQNAKEWNGALAAHGLELDRLRAKYNPLFAVISAYKQSLTEIRTANAIGAISHDEMTAAISRQRQATLGMIDVIKGRNKALAETPVHSTIEPAPALPETAMQRRINASVGLHSGPANEDAPQWTGALAAQGLELDRLRAKYNPLFAVISAYKQSLTEIRTAHAQGALSTDEMSAAISRQRQATLGLIDTIKGRNKALLDTPVAHGLGGVGGVGAFQTANIAAQFQDIGVTAALGMSPTQIGLQQGTQLASIFAQMGNGRQIVAGLGAAFASIISPISLITIGLVAGTAALVQYFTTADDGTTKTNGLLGEQVDIIKQAASSWGDALPSVKAYADQIERAKKDAEAQDATQILGGRALDGLGDQIKGLVKEFGGAVSSLRGIDADPAFIRDFASAFGTLRQRLDDGTASVEDVNRAQKELAFAVGNYGTKQVLNFRDAWDKVTISLRNGVNEAKKVREEWLKVVAGGTSVQDIVAGASFTDPNGGVHQTATFTPKIGPVPEKRPLVELDGLPGEVKKEETQAEKARKAYADLIKSADDRIAQMKLEAGLAGETGIAVDTLRFRLELLQKLETDGVKASPEQLKVLDNKAAAYRKYAEAAAEAGLRAKLEFERAQLGRTALDQDIANQQRAAGLSVNLDSYEAALIRQNERLKESKELTGDFVKTLVGGLREGQSLWEALGNSALNVLSKIAEKALEDQIAGLFGGAPSASPASGAGGLAGILGSLFSGGRSAPPAANQNGLAQAISGDMLAYRNSIKAIESSGNYGALGPLTRGDRAYGAYQVMGNNIPAWTKEALGTSLTPNQYLANPGAQDAVFDRFFGKSLSRYGNPQDAASVWFSGRPLASAGGATDVLGTSANAYVEKFNAQLGRLSATTAGATENIGGFGGALGKIGQSLGGAFPAAPAAGGGLFSGIGGFFSKLFGGYNPTLFSSQAAGLASLAGTGVGLFDTGGFTGLHPIDKIAGFVHGQEFVVKADVTRKPGVLSFLNALNDNKLPGFASGGFVGPRSDRSPVFAMPSADGANSGRISIAVHNYAGVSVHADEQEDDRGGRSVQFVIEDTMSGGVGRPGSAVQRAMKSTFGMTPRVKRS